ncbi:Glycosyltransferase involved in cell wall bisynthesis [Friedmanniella luteola]|uniref:Glycosyltransferase involved in cell wall bisynthesis n=1 Tax=Friedmanniella luteola TaxID=546871 RepID=A0A1H1WHF8_9ACTN|nr:glycosyltransferase [Friedmanniella luteola]SDS95609.1 Glycosyltransferase involved in cell wall bisynthesis [Friedmanniella luteola]
MKILLGADQYPEYINGAATFTRRLATGLAAAGHTVDLLWPAADGAHRTHLDQGVRVHRLSSVTLPGRPRMQVCTPRVVDRQVEQVLQVARPDVVHVQSHLLLGRALVRAGRRAGVPVVATNHFMPENIVPHVPVVRRFPRLASRLAWRDLEQVYAGAQLLTAPTGRAVDLLARATRLAPAEAISCGVDLDRFGAAAAEPDAADATRRGPLALFVGRLEPEKNLDQLLAAFARVPTALGARLEVVGMGSRRGQLEEQARALDLRGRVTFTGAVDDDELVAACGRADVFVMPGTAELQSLATLEAMAAGLPVVAAEAMALPHLVQDGRNGHLVPPGDVDVLARQLTRLLGDPPLRTRMGRASRAVAEGHALAATVALFDERYTQLVEDRRPVPAAAGPDLALVP